MAVIVVERTFDPPLAPEDLAATEARMKPCFEIYRVRWIRSFWSQDRKRMICQYEAPDAEAVRMVQLDAAAKFDAVWRAALIE